MNEQELSVLQSRLERLLGFLNSDPENPDLLVDCGHLNHRLGRFDAARQYLDRALGIQPENPRALDERGKLALSENELAEAVTLFRHSLSLQNVQVPETLVNLGIALNHMESWDEAASCLSEASLIRADSPQLFRHLAMAEHHRGEFEAAISAAKRWNEMVDDATSSGYLSLIYLDCEQWEEAEHYARQALSYDREQSDANIVLGTIALNSMHIAQAANYYAAANSYPGNGRALLGLGLSHLCQQEPVAAEECLHLAVQAMPGYVTGWVTLGWVKIGLGRYDEALNIFERAVACDRTFSEAQGGLASAYALLGRYDEAEQREKVASKLDPDCFGSIFARSLLSAGRGNIAEGQRLILEGMARPVQPGMPALQDLARRLITTKRRPS